jgi:hypothetical protein
MATRYIVFAGKHEPYLAERELSEMTSEATLRDMISGEWENVRQVIAISDSDKQSGVWTDVTDIFARACMNAWAQSGEPLTRWQRDFVETHISIQAANSFRRAEMA